MSGYLDTDIEIFHLRPLMLVELSWVAYKSDQLLDLFKSFRFVISNLTLARKVIIQ